MFALLKTAYRDNVERMERGGVNTVNKEHFTSLYSPIRERAFTKRNILIGWSKSGLFSFNPDRVLKDLAKPLPELVGVDTIVTGPTLYNRTLTASRVPAIPTTPVTPVSVEALMSLQDLIVLHDA